MNYIKVLLLIFFFSVFSVFVYAQSDTEMIPIPEIDESEFTEVEKNSVLDLFKEIGGVVVEEGDALSDEEPASCFDYYRFNSVQVPIDPVLQGTVAGAPMTFTGEMINENAYPILNGTLYAKIFKKRADVEKNSNGPEVVDQFVVRENVVLPATSSTSVAFDWNVPAWSTTGNYKIAMFFISEKKYNLLGLSFTDDVVGNTTSFEVLSDIPAGVVLNKDSVTVAGSPYRFAAFPPRVESEDFVEITNEVVNNTDERQTVPIIFTVYSWDAIQSSKNLVATEVKQVTIDPKSSKDILYILRDTEHPVYLVESRLKYRDTQSILNIRLVRDGINKLRINFPSVMSYPIVAGATSTVFSCFHNISEDFVPGKLIITITGEQGEVVHSFEQVGSFGGDMQVAVSDFISQETLKTFNVKAQLYQNDTVVDEVIMQYRCEDFNNCDVPSEEENYTIWFVVIGVGLVVLLLLVIKMIRTVLTKKKDNNYV